MQGLARQLGTTWRTVWRSIKPLLELMAAVPDRFDNVASLGDDEHIGTTSRPSLSKPAAEAPKSSQGWST